MERRFPNHQLYRGQFRQIYRGRFGNRRSIFYYQLGHI